jgi:hypothetical protein
MVEYRSCRTRETISPHDCHSAQPPIMNIKSLIGPENKLVIFVGF